MPQTEVRASTSNGTGWNFSNTIHNPGTDDAYALLTFDLPAPRQKGVIAGELHLAWSAEPVTRRDETTLVPSTPTPTHRDETVFVPPTPMPMHRDELTLAPPTPPVGMTPASPAVSFPVTDHDELRPTRGDERIESSVRKLNPSNQLAFRANLPYQARASVKLALDTTVTPKKWVHSHPSQTHRAVSNPSQFEEFSRANRLVCETLLLNPEWFPDTCTTVLRR